MATQETAPEDTESTADADLVWVKSPATGRLKQVSKAKADILARAKWEVQDKEPAADDPLIVAAFPTAQEEEAAAEQAAEEPAEQPDQKNARTGRRAAAEKEGS